MILAACGWVLRQLLTELRHSTQQWRARVSELEAEKDGLIRQTAAAQGVGIEGAPSKPMRTEWADPETGFIYFGDGEIRDPHGNTVVEAGAIEANLDLLLPPEE